MVWLPSYTRKHRIPHDLAHVVTERELGMARGVFGSIASGGTLGEQRAALRPDDALQVSWPRRLVLPAPR